MYGFFFNTPMFQDPTIKMKHFIVHRKFSTLILLSTSLAKVIEIYKTGSGQPAFEPK